MDVSLKTERLILRKPVIADAERITLLLNNFLVAGNLAQVPFPYHLTDAEAWLATSTPDLPPEDTTFSIVVPREGVAGAVGFGRRDGRTILGYYLGEPFWGRGLMTEAAAAAIGWLFATTTLKELHSGAFHFNLASLAVQRKLGFVTTGRGMLYSRSRGEELDHVDTSLPRNAFCQIEGRAPWTSL